jgi:cytochrome c-type biogenesis protein CcmH
MQIVEIWLVFAVLLTAATAVIMFTSLRPSRANQNQSFTPSNAVYRDQLSGLDAEIKSGQVPAKEARALRTEIARRILAEGTPTPAKFSNASRVMPFVFALLIPAIALPAYLHAGHPALPDTPLVARLDNAVASNDLAAMVAQVENHLAEKPNDVNGWKILAPVYTELGRYRDSANAFQQILRLSEPTAELHANMGEAMVMDGNGLVSSLAARTFKAALELDASNPKARYYNALALKQEGKKDAAREEFQSLLQTSPPDAPWRKIVEQDLADLAKAPTLSDEQIATGQDMKTEDRQQMIKSMVDGLEQKLGDNSNDIDGWMRLIRARTVLGETDRARAALVKAGQLFKDQPVKTASLEALARELKLQ